MQRLDRHIQETERMRTRTLLGTLAAAALAGAAAPAAAQSFLVEGFGGYQYLQLSVDNLGGAVNGNQDTGIAGGDFVVAFGRIGVGLLVDKTVSGSIQPWAGAILAGFLVPLSVVRIEVLGELGRRGFEFADIFRMEGRTFVGFRPGVSFRIPATPVFIGASGIARWDTSNGEFGKPDYGIVARLGLGMF
jgi:hypothetical protein